MADNEAPLRIQEVTSLSVDSVASMAVRARGMRLREYFPILWKDLVARMSGFGSVALAFWVTYWPPAAQETKTLLWILVFICLLIASYRAWLHERKNAETRIAALQTQIRLEQAKNAKAELRGELQDCVMSPIFNHDYHTGKWESVGRLLITLKLYFTNHRPTAVTIKRFGFSIRLTSGHNYTAHYALDEKIRQSDDRLYEGKELNNLRDIIEERRLAKHGKGFDGYLMFEVREFQQADIDDLAKSTISVSITDSLNNMHSIAEWGLIEPYKRIIVQEIPERERRTYRDEGL